MSNPGHGPGDGNAVATALDWLLRSQSSGTDPMEDPAFRAWLESDPLNLGTYSRAKTVWQDPAFLQALASKREKRGPSPTAWMMRIAASIAMIAVLGSATLRLTGTALRWPSDYAAPIGGQLHASLDDKTQVVLDSGAAIDLAYDSRARTISLRSGRAFVDVGRDTRPFRIMAGTVEVRDIGTRFSVERDGAVVRVAVERGEVALRPADETRPEQHLTAGQTGGYAQGFLPVWAVPNDISFAWLDHRLFFSQQPLGEVVQQLRRYHRGWIVVATPRLANVKISGGYDTRDPVSAMEDLARLSDGTLIRLSDRLLILR